jgi:signal transduction histidine kinase
VQTQPRDKARGRGISEEHLPRIFEKFYKVPRLENADVPGAGLGLALVREIAELHGGSVTVTSKVNTVPRLPCAFLWAKPPDCTLDRQRSKFRGRSNGARDAIPAEDSRSRR